MKIVPLGPRATVAESSALASACTEAESSYDEVEFDASETSRFGPLGVAMLAASFAVRRAAGRQTRMIPPLTADAAAFLNEIEFERIASAGAESSGTLELRQMHALDARYTQDVAQILERGVPGITEENSYPIQLCLNELLQNVFEWSHSPVGCFVLVRWFKGSRSVRLAVVDRGIGIPAALRRAKIQDLQRLDDASVIEASASRPRLTSRANQVGGLGLKTIREIVCERNGNLTILSLGAKVRWSGSKIFRSKSPPFRGTAIEIEFRPDAPFEPDDSPAIF